MMSRLRTYLLTLLCSLSAPAQQIEFNGQISAYHSLVQKGTAWNNESGLHYFPQCNVNAPADETKMFNVEVLLRASAGTDYHQGRETFSLYRGIVRYSTAQSETQIGLQKINFGPAQLLRSLMWFDSVEPSDPLKITEGVYAFRYKYTSVGNSILWLWGLYGNKNTKGIETTPSAEKCPELGGRYQFPLLSGECGITAHSRRAKSGKIEYRENRIALDSRWDAGIGLWHESVLQYSQPPFNAQAWEKMLTLGTDYTFPFGNGVYCALEYMTRNRSGILSGFNPHSDAAAALLTYPLTLVDNLVFIGYYSPQNGESLQYFQWQRNFDDWMLNASVFLASTANPEMRGTGNGILTGRAGLQCMLIYNY